MIKIPFLTTAMLFMKCCELAAGGSGVLVGWMKGKQNPVKATE